MRTPRMYFHSRFSTSARVSALIIPRSATIPTDPIPNRLFNRSRMGTRLFTSAVVPGQRGHSKDHRPDLKQMVVGMVLDQNGNPLCSQRWPGNTADVKSLVPIVERLKKRFGIGSVCIVA